MWDLGSGDIVVLVSVISGWAVLLKIFGPLIGSTITIGVILCGWLIYNIGEDTPLSPHVFLPLYYFEQAAIRTSRFSKHIWQQFILIISIFARNLAHLYRVNVVERMAQRRRSTYQLSSEAGPCSKNPSRFSLVDGLSPIARAHFRNLENSTNLENTPFLRTERRLLERANSLGQLTSTPLVASKKDDPKNGDVTTAERRVNNWRHSQSFTQNHTLSRGEETNYSPEGSPWGTSISPKMRPRAAGVKTVQTVAGPLLASTRYNIDPKVYSDVTSPGLTTRLTKYATEANTKLTHQSQYGAGQFPRVNLNASPTPFMSAKTGKMRAPVMVTIAPPEISRSPEYERLDILLAEKTNKYQAKPRKEQQPQPSEVQALREISLKRHASREDVTYEMAKKQRRERIYSESFMSLEEITQKRGRDDSSRSEEETASPHCKILRPTKRSKMPSCHDILSSLSSSINVSSGVKRKAIDVSRSGTPVVGKHFKSLDSSQPENTEKSVSLSRTVSEPMRTTNKRSPNDSGELGSAFDLERATKRCLESVAQKQPENSSSPSNKPEPKVARSETRVATTQENFQRKVQLAETKIDEPVKLTEKLFMRARPENIDKIKTLIEEHDSIKPRFTTDSTDEIKKSDIVNMRQTSMKNRLKSMFDAISGKGTSKINPEVVIQAEDKSTSSESIVVASLSSSTSTTNVNTSPIATSAIVPIIGKSKSISTASKHVTFQISNNDSGPKTSLETPQISTETPKEAKPSQAPETTSSVDPSSVKATSPIQVSATSIATSLVSSASTPQIASPMFNFTSGTSAFGVAATTITKSVSTPPTGFQSNEKNSPTINFSFGVAKTATTTGQNIGSLGNGQALDVKAVSAPISIVSASTATTTSASSLFSFTSVASKPIVAQTLSSSSESARSPDQGAGKASTGQSGFWASSGEQVSTLRNPSSTFGPTSSAPASATPTGFTYTKNPMSEALFGTSSAGTPSTTSSFTMGTNLNSSATAKPVFSFGTTNSTLEPAVSFGTSSSIASPSTQTNLFRAAATTTSAQPNLFGNPATTVTATTTSPANVFGAPASAPATTTTAATLAPSLFSFGSTSGQSTSFTNTFGLPKSTKSGEISRFVGITVPAAASTSSSTFATATKPSGLFGTGNTETNPTTSSAPLPSFGQKPAVPTFGTNSSASGFSKSNVNAPSLFEAQNNEQTFGATSSATPGTSGAPPSYTFSNATAASTGFGVPSTAPPAFGSTNTLTTSFGAATTASPAAAATTFGSLNTTTPTFGTPNSSIATVANQNTTSLNFAPSSATFGAVATTAPPAFPTATTSGFGTSAGTSTFGTLTNPSPAFSTAKTFTGFGAPANATLPFGSQPSTTNSSFGTANTSSIAFGATNNNPNNNANTSFTFGSSQPNSQQPQQQNAVFTFGGGAPSNAANNTTTGSSAFQFNSAPQSTGGFNFTGAPATPAINFSKDGAPGSSFALPTPGINSFSVPPAAGGMFSIGTGSTAPRTRPSRRRQR